MMPNKPKYRKDKDRRPGLRAEIVVAIIRGLEEHFHRSLMPALVGQINRSTVRVLVHGVEFHIKVNEKHLRPKQ